MRLSLFLIFTSVFYSCSGEVVGYRTTPSDAPADTLDDRAITSKSQNATASGSDTDVDAEFAALKADIKELWKALEKEIKDRKDGDQKLQTQIDEIRAHLALIDVNIVEIKGRLSEESTLTQDLLTEFNDLKREHGDRLAALETSQAANNQKITDLSDEIDHLKGLLTDQKDLSSEMFEKIRAEIAAKQTQYEAQLADLANQQEQTTTLIQQVQDQAIRLALEAEHNFAISIKELAEKNNALIESVVEGMEVLAGRIEGLESRVEIVEAAVDEINKSLAEINATVDALESDSEATKARVTALEQFKKVAQLCAAVGTGLATTDRTLLKAQQRNRSLFGPSRSAQFGYGNLYAKLNRMRKADVVFDQYHYNLTMQNQLRQQIAMVQGACAAMIAFPDRPDEYGPYPVVGLTQSPVAGGEPVRWNMPTDVDVRQTFRVLPAPLQTADNKSKLNKILTAYNNIFASGTELTPADWDRHFIALTTLATNGLYLVAQSASFVENHMASNARLSQLLPNDERNAICRFGNGQASRDDVDGLQYADLETAIVNGVEERYHLPQQFYYQKTDNTIYLAKAGYNMSMGPSAKQVLDILDSTTGLAGLTDADELLATASGINVYEQYPTVLERNVTRHLTQKWRKADSVCRGKYFQRDGYRSAVFSRRATIPFSKVQGCWRDNIGHTGNVCSSLLFNPEGDPASPDPELRRYSARSYSNKARHKVQSYQVSELTPANYPEGTFAASESLDNTYVLELFYESEAEKFAGKSEEMCRTEARYPNEDMTVRYRVWKNLKDEFALKNVALFRNVAHTDTGARFLVRACLRGQHAPYNQPIHVNGEKSTKHRLVFQPDMFLPIAGDDNGNLRLAATASRCSDMCSALDLDGNGLPDNGTGFIAYYGNANNPGDPLTYNRSLATGLPWTYDIRGMVNKDQCHCQVAVPTTSGN